MARQASSKAIDRRIEAVYRLRCNGTQINIMQIGTLFAMARKLILDGCDDDALGACMVAFVRAGD